MPEGKEGKESKEGKEADTSVDLHPLVVKFIEFSLSADLNQVCKEFVVENCEPFKDSQDLLESGTGYPIEWSMIHEKFLERVDERLSLFAQENGTSEEELFGLLEEGAGDDVFTSNYLPHFLKLLDFESFVSQMTCQAGLEEAAKEAETFSEGWSGKWKFMYDYSKKKHDAFLKYAKVPWVMRKTITSLLSSKKFIGVVDCIPGESMSRTYNLGPAGTRTEQLTQDEWKAHPRRKETRVKGVMSKSGNEFYVYSQKMLDSTLKKKKGTKTHVQEWWLSDDQQHMFCKEFIALDEDLSQPISPIFTYHGNRQ